MSYKKGEAYEAPVGEVLVDESPAVANVSLVLITIQEKVFRNLDCGGNGVDHPIVKEQKAGDVYDIINGYPVHIPKRTHITLIRYKIPLNHLGDGTQPDIKKTPKKNQSGKEVLDKVSLERVSFIVDILKFK